MPMKKLILAACLVLAACASPPVSQTSSTLIAADAATSLTVGDRVTELVSAQSAQEGMDPVVTLTLRHADGRSFSFQEANHTNNDLFVQRAGGALAQIIGLHAGDEVTTLYYAADGERSQPAEAAFFCGPQGPAAIGKYEAADGAIQIVGLREPIQVEARADGELEAVPYSPDAVCARLRFRRG
jgi:hypothetical protein